MKTAEFDKPLTVESITKRQTMEFCKKMIVGIRNGMGQDMAGLIPLKGMRDAQDIFNRHIHNLNCMMQEAETAAHMPAPRFSGTAEGKSRETRSGADVPRAGDRRVEGQMAEWQKNANVAMRHKGSTNHDEAEIIDMVTGEILHQCAFDHAGFTWRDVKTGEEIQNWRELRAI